MNAAKALFSAVVVMAGAISSARADKLTDVAQFPKAEAIFGALSVTGQTVVARDSGGLCLGCAQVDPGIRLQLRSPNIILRLQPTGSFPPPVELIAGRDALGKLFKIHHPVNGTDWLVLDSRGHVALNYPAPTDAIATIGGSHAIELEHSPGADQITFQPELPGVGASKWELGTLGPDLRVRSVPTGALRIELVYGADGTLRFGRSDLLATRPIDSANQVMFDNGAKFRQGGGWIDASNRALKEEIEPLPPGEAAAVLAAMEPVTFRYKATPEEQTVGFIAEAVPDLVAEPGRRSLAEGKVLSVLVGVVKDQERRIQELKAKLRGKGR